MSDSVATKNEREILRVFFETINDINPQDNTVSDLKIVNATQNKLKVALRGSEQRCTCAKMTWGGICETCQGSDKELVFLRNFYRQIRNAKKYNMTAANLIEFIENTKKKLAD